MQISTKSLDNLQCLLLFLYNPDGLNINKKEPMSMLVIKT